MRRYFTVVLVIIMVCMFAVTAQAGIPGWDVIRDWVGGTAVALIISGLLSIGVIAVWTDWFSVILIALGGLFISVGVAIADRKLTKDELADWKVKWTAFRQSLKRPKPNG